MSEQDAWAAGLFDGEGTVVVRCRGPRNLPCIQIALGMTDYDVVRRFADYIGVDHIVARQSRGGYKDQWYVSLAQPERIAQLFEAWRPWLGQRRAKAFEDGLAAVQAKGSNPRWTNPDGTCRQCGLPREQGQGCATCRRARYTRYNHRVRPPRSDRDCQEAS